MPTAVTRGSSTFRAITYAPWNGVPSERSTCPVIVPYELANDGAGYEQVVRDRAVRVEDDRAQAVAALAEVRRVVGRRHVDGQRARVAERDRRGRHRRPHAEVARDHADRGGVVDRTERAAVGVER